MARATASGMEWFTWMGSTVKQPSLNFWCGAISTIFVLRTSPCSSSLLVMSPIGKARGINGQIDLFEQVGQAADVVFMAVRDNNALDAVLILDNIGEIRNDEVHAEHVAVREHDAAVARGSYRPDTRTE